MDEKILKRRNGPALRGPVSKSETSAVSLFYAKELRSTPSHFLMTSMITVPDI